MCSGSWASRSSSSRTTSASSPATWTASTSCTRAASWNAARFTRCFDDPRHPYTKGLLASVPRLDKPKGERLIPIEGMPPDLSNLPPGCAFRDRCAYAVERCEQDTPEVRHVRGAGPEHLAACWAVETESAA